MELFTIECTTCRARLKVNDESVIGDILACPKCHSMVHVVPPLGWSQTLSMSGLSSDTTQGVAWPPNHPSQTAAKNKPAATASRQLPPALPVPGQPRAVAASKQPPPVTQVAASQPGQLPPIPTAPALSSAGASDPSVSFEHRAPAVSGTRQQWKVIAGGLVGGMLLGGGIWLALAVQAPPLEHPQPPSDVLARPAAADLPDSNYTTDAQPAATSIAIAPSSGRAEPVAAGLDEPAAEPAEPQPAATDLDASRNDSAAASNPVAAAEPARRPTLKLDPVPTIDNRPSGTGAGGSIDSAQASAAAGSEETVLPAADVAAGESDGLPQHVISAAQIQERLAQEFPRIEFSKTPLAKFLDFVADIAGVRVRIEDSSVEHLKAGRLSPVSVKLANATVGDALHAAVSGLGLTYTVEDGQIVIARHVEPAAEK